MATCCATKIQLGITGWAQINSYRDGFNTIPKMQKRVERDLVLYSALSRFGWIYR